VRPLLSARAETPLAAEPLTEERLQEAFALAPVSAYGYRSDWKLFSTWCAAKQLPALPATRDTVVAYLLDRLNGGYRINSVSRHLSAIRHWHLEAGFPSPCTPDIHRLLDGARRIRAERLDQRTPLSPEQLGRIATALRRYNLTLLDLEDLHWHASGLEVSIRREKQDQWGAGRSIAIPPGHEHCPLDALHKWLAIRGDGPGPLFTQTVGAGHVVTLKRLHPQRVCWMLKRAVKLIGLDPRHYGAHSLRAGFVTTAVENGATILQVAEHTGHRSLASLRRYYRPQDPFAGAGRIAGL
jgi:integrase